MVDGELQDSTADRWEVLSRWYVASEWERGERKGSVASGVPLYLKDGTVSGWDVATVKLKRREPPA
jgi:hypothetical protein